MITHLERLQPFKLPVRLLIPMEMLAIVLASIPAIWPLTSPGFLQGQDYMDTPWRALELLQALKEGVLFPRWSPDLFYDFGFPIFNFFSPLSYYEVVIVRILGAADLVQASKVTFAVTYIVAGIGAYAMAKSIGLGRGPAIVAGVVYMYSPLNLRDLYGRSALATLGATALLPYVLMAFGRLCRQKTLCSFSLASGLLAAMILTHNLTSVLALGMVFCLVATYCWHGHDRRAIVLAVAAVILALGLTAFFTVPAIGELSLTHTEKLTSGVLDYHFQFVDPLGDADRTIEKQSADATYNLTRWGAIDLHLAYPYGLPPLKLSLIQGLLILAFVTTLIAQRRPPSQWIVSAAIMSLGLFYLSTSWSQWLWERVPILPPFQFPWRMLIPMGLCVALLGAWVIHTLSGRQATVVAILLSSATILAGMWMLPTEMAPFEGGVQVNRESLIRHEYRERNRIGTMVDGQFLPLSVQWDEETLHFGDILPRYDTTFPPEKWVGQTAFIDSGSRAWITAARRGQLWMEAQVQAGEATRVSFHTVFFPGWTAYIDGQPAAIEPSGWQSDSEGRRVALGVCQVTVPEGNHVVRIQFEDTPIRRFAKTVSLASLITLGIILVAASRRKHGARNTLIIAVVLLTSCVAVRMLLSLVSYVPKWTENREALNLIVEAERQQLEVRVPADGNAGQQIGIREFTINGERRNVLYMHPPASASKRLWIPTGATLELGIAMDPEVWPEAGDGVEFRVEAVKGANTITLLSKYINPKSDEADRGWIDLSVNLQPLANEEVELVFRTMPGTSADFDWAGWSNPRVMLGSIVAIPVPVYNAVHLPFVRGDAPLDSAHK